jgi:hypothetical protein
MVNYLNSKIAYDPYNEIDYKGQTLTQFYAFININ